MDLTISPIHTSPSLALHPELKVYLQKGSKKKGLHIFVIGLNLWGDILSTLHYNPFNKQTGDEILNLAGTTIEP